MRIASKIREWLPKDNNTIKLDAGSSAIILGRNPNVSVHFYESSSEEYATFTPEQMTAQMVNSLVTLALLAQLEQPEANLTFGDAIYYAGLESGIPHEVMEMTARTITNGGWTMEKGNHGGVYGTARTRSQTATNTLEG